MVTTFFPLQVYGDFSKRSRAANSMVPGRILPNFEFICNIMVDLVTYKNEEDLIKMKALEWSHDSPPL